MGPGKPALSFRGAVAPLHPDSLALWLSGSLALWLSGSLNIGWGWWVMLQRKQSVHRVCERSLLGRARHARDSPQQQSARSGNLCDQERKQKSRQMSVVVETHPLCTGRLPRVGGLGSTL